jgi:hypothetical protein
MKHLIFILVFFVLISLTAHVNAAYCSSSSNTTAYDYIRMVTLGTGNKTSVASTYSDNTGTIFTGLARGETYTIYVEAYIESLAFPSNDYVKAWIDYDTDYNLNDSGEEIDLGNYTVSGNVTHLFSNAFTVPQNAHLSTTRMRVSLMYNWPPQPCGSFPLGEVEDYSIQITETTSTSSTTTLQDTTTSTTTVGTTTSTSTGSTTTSSSTGSTTTTGAATTSTSSGSTTTTGGSATTTTVSCVLPGDNPPCGNVSIQEIVDAINSWATDSGATLQQIVDLINTWAVTP